MRDLREAGPPRLQDLSTLSEHTAVGMKVLLLGMNNPHAESDPLSPFFTAGKRLFEMSGMSLAEYEARFERRNLIEARKWSRIAGRRAWRSLSLERYRGAVLLGREVAAAGGLEHLEPFSPEIFRGRPLVMVYHPSGLSRAYNEEACRHRLRDLLRQFAELEPWRGERLG